MIKSVTIRDLRDNRIMFKVLIRKSGVYELVIDADLYHRLTVDVRDETGHKVKFGKDSKPNEND